MDFYGGGHDSGSILDEYVESLSVLPVEMRRYLDLLRDLDKGRLRDEAELQQLRSKYLHGTNARL